MNFPKTKAQSFPVRTVPGDRRPGGVSRWRSVPAALAMLIVPAVSAQQWEFGVAGGGSSFLDKTLSSSRGVAETGLKPGFAAGAWLGNTIGERFGGELRYQFGRNDLKLSSGGTSIGFGAQSHQVTYEFLFYPGSNSARVRPYLAAGGGLKAYQGTGTENPYQPLLQFAALTKTLQWKPVVTFGGGVKWSLNDRVTLRLEVRDSVTPWPNVVILPVAPHTVSGWLHNIVPMFGLSYSFEPLE